MINASSLMILSLLVGGEPAASKAGVTESLPELSLVFEPGDAFAIRTGLKVPEEWAQDALEGHVDAEYLWRWYPSPKRSFSLEGGSYVIFGALPGKYVLDHELDVTNFERRKSQRVIQRIIVTVLGPRGPPEPPKPEPPDTEETLLPGDGFRILILRDDTRLPIAQATAVNSTQARDFVKSKGGELRSIHIADDWATEPEWKPAAEAARAKVGFAAPWLVIGNGGKGESIPFPDTEDDFMSILERFAK